MLQAKSRVLGPRQQRGAVSPPPPESSAQQVITPAWAPRWWALASSMGAGQSSSTIPPTTPPPGRPLVAASERGLGSCRLPGCQPAGKTEMNKNKHGRGSEKPREQEQSCHTRALQTRPRRGPGATAAGKGCGSKGGPALGLKKCVVGRWGVGDLQMPG